MINDDELATSIKVSFASVHMTTQLDSVLRLGRSRRTRNRLARLTGVGTVAVVIALAMLSLVPRSGPAPRLAAWAIVIQPHHRLRVTIHELRDPSRLQRLLRADGVPATVRFGNQNPRRCLFYPGSPARLTMLMKRIFPDASSVQVQSGAAFDIDASAIPRGAAVWLNVYPPRTVKAHNVAFATTEALVYANGHCPAS